jgi:hypothetical protein
MSASNRPVQNGNHEAKDDHSNLAADDATFKKILKESEGDAYLIKSRRDAHRAAEQTAQDKILAQIMAESQSTENARLKRIADAKAAEADFERVLRESGQSEGDRIASQALARANAEREKFDREVREAEAAEALAAAQLMAATLQAEHDRQAKAQALLIKQAIEKAAAEAQRQNALMAQMQAEQLRQIEEMARVEQAAAQRKQLDKERGNLFSEGVDLLQQLAQYEKPALALERYDSFAALHADKNSDQAQVNESMRAVVTALPQIIEDKKAERFSQTQARLTKQKTASEAAALLKQQEAARQQAILAQQMQAAEKAAKEKAEQKQKAQAEADSMKAQQAAQAKIEANKAAALKAEQVAQAKTEAEKAAAVKAEADRVKAQQARTEASAKEKASKRSMFFFAGKENDPRRIPGVEVISPTRVFHNRNIFDETISAVELLQLKEYAKQAKHLSKTGELVELKDNTDNSPYSSSHSARKQ